MSILNVHDFGNPDGHIVFAVHGITAHGRRFRRLAEQGWPERHTVAVDLRGHGRSLSDGPWSVERHVTDLIDTLDSLDIETMDYLGHSYGGMIGLNLLARAPERIRRMALTDPALARPADAMNAAATAEIANPGFVSIEDAVANHRTGFTDDMLPAVMENIDEHLVLGSDGRYRFRYHRPAVIAGWGELCAHPPVITHSRPTLVVVADRSGLVTPTILDDLRSGLGADLSVVHIDSGHTIDWERFDETAHAITSFLGAV